MALKPPLKFLSALRMPDALFDKFAAGRTDLMFELLERGHSAAALTESCAYYGDVTAIKYLHRAGVSLANVTLGGASFHGHWQLCHYLLEQGADVNEANDETGETPLHSALCHTDRVVYDRVVQVLLSYGANPNAATKPHIETGAFMRDCRTKGETPLHRAAAFGEPETIDMLLKAGSVIDARDAFGDTPLSWGSWYGRPTSILRLLLYGDFHINPKNRSMRANLLGDPST